MRLLLLWVVFSGLVSVQPALIQLTLSRSVTMSSRLQPIALFCATPSRFGDEDELTMQSAPVSPIPDEEVVAVLDHAARGRPRKTAAATADPAAAAGAAAAAADAAATDDAATDDDSVLSVPPRKLKVAQLRLELKRRGRSSSGLKPQLVERLEQLLEREALGEATVPRWEQACAAPEELTEEELRFHRCLGQRPLFMHRATGWAKLHSLQDGGHFCCIGTAGARCAQVLGDARVRQHDHDARWQLGECGRGPERGGLSTVCEDLRVFLPRARYLLELSPRSV